MPNIKKPVVGKIVVKTKQTLVKIREGQLRRAKITKVKLQELPEPSIDGADESESIRHKKRMQQGAHLDDLEEDQSSDF